MVLRSLHLPYMYSQLHLTLNRVTSHADNIVSVVSDPTQPVSPLVMLLAQLSLSFIGA